MTTLQPMGEPQADSWTMGLTDSRVLQTRRILLTDQKAPSPFLTAPRLSTSPAPSHESLWLADVEDEIRSYSELAPDWDSYGGRPASTRNVDAAVAVAKIMARYGFSQPDVCPESSGGVLLEWQQSDKVLTVDLDGIDGLSFAYESLVEPESEGGIEDFISFLNAGPQPF